MNHLSLILFICSPCFAWAQNHIPNPSFEYFTTCPINNLYPNLTDEMAKAFPWNSFKGSPDYFNPCVTNPNLWCDAPNTGLGYQQAYEGDSFAGFLFGRQDYATSDFEVIGCPLLQPLTVGERYFVSMRFSLSDLRLNAGNHIGALFLTHGHDGLTNPMTFPDKCHVCTDSVIIDYANWVEVSGVFEADSAYTHIAIGHFLDSTSFAILPGAPGQGTPIGPYYFVDNVCVVPEGGDCGIPLSVSQPHQPAAFTAYPNPIIKSQSPTLHFSKESSLEVYDLMGQSMGHYENVVEVDAGGWPAGVYLLRERGGGITKIIVME